MEKKTNFYDKYLRFGTKIKIKKMTYIKVFYKISFIL